MSTTRRQFLTGVVSATAAATAAPYVITSSALGAPGVAPASDRLAMAHIGIGNQGSGHFSGMLNNGRCRILAVCDVKREVRESCKKRVDDKYGASGGKGCAAYNDFRDLMDRTDIDGVIIAVPPHWHALIGIAAAQSGKDVYCEKPLALTVRQARAMVTVVRRYGRVLQTGSQQRSSSEFRKACELIRNGRLGDLKAIYVNIGMPSADKQFVEEPVPEGLDWNLWLGPAPWAPYNHERCSGDYGGGWRFVRDYSGGMTTDWGAHHFDIAQWALGMDSSGPVEIFPPDGKDHKNLTYRYSSGILMYRAGKTEQGQNVNGILFTGAKGQIEVNRGFFKSYPDEIGQQPLGPANIRLYTSNDHMGNWLDCIRTRRRPICDVEIGCRSVTVCHLGNIASWLGRSIKWDPAKEEIIGDAEAGRWLDRPMRAPWRLT
jgi:predicted dehydrogenase